MVVDLVGDEGKVEQSSAGKEGGGEAVTQNKEKSLKDEVER